MTADVLFSGSSGNCTLIRSGDSSILIDCGKSAKAVRCALADVGASLDGVEAIFITHEHADHTSALPAVLSKHPVPVHITERSAAELLKYRPELEKYLVTHKTEYTETAGPFTVSSFPLPHDSACHVGYVITDGSVSVGVATDMGYVTERAAAELCRCRSVIIESNHDVEMLENGRYPYFLKRRILSPRGHLSNGDCAALACELARAGVGAIALAHLSEENNDPRIAYEEIRGALDAEGFPDVILTVADRNAPTRLPCPEPEKEAPVC